MGYQKFTTPDSQYQLTAGTFVNLTDTAIPLRDFVAKSLSDERFFLANFQLIFFGSNGSPMKVKDDAQMKDTEAFSAAYEAFKDSNLTFGKFWRDGNWYLVDDTGLTYSMNDYKVAPGRGFNILVSGHSGGVELTVSGAVPEEDYEVTVPDSSYALSGNSMPADVALKELTTQSLSDERFFLANFQLVFFGSNGSPMKVKDDAQMRDTEAFSAAYEAFKDSNLTFGKFWRDGNWYLVDDTGLTYPMNDYIIKAGRGFNILVSGHTGGVKVTVPSPILDQKAAE